MTSYASPLRTDRALPEAPPLRAETPARRGRRRRTAFTAAAFAGLAALAVSQHSLLVRSARSITAARPQAVALAVLAEGLSLVAFALVHWRLLRVAGVPVGFASVAAIALGGNAISGTVPLAGSELGTRYTYRQFRGRGVDAATAAWVLLISGVVASLTFCAIVAATALSSHESAASLGGLLLAALVAGALGVGLVALRRPKLRERLEQVAVGVGHAAARLRRRPAGGTDAAIGAVTERLDSLDAGPGVLGSVAASSVVNWMADVACAALAVVAVGGSLRWPVVLLAWVAAASAATLQITPGGLGVTEAAMVGTFVASGMPVGTATAAVLLYRLVSYWLPVAGGVGVLTFQRRRPTGAVTP